MFKFFVVFLLSIVFTSFSGASILKEKVKNIIGTNDYRIHNSLINLLFQDENKYIVNGNIRYYKFFKTLQENGLLKLRLDKPSDIEIEFKSKNNNFKAYKILNDTMQVLGYRYFFTKSMKVPQQENLDWTIIYKAEYMLNHVMFLKELAKNRSKILNVTNNGSNKWTYEIDFKNAELTNAVKIDKNEKVKFQKPLRAYMLKVTETKSLQVISRKLNHWFPHIVFFDKNLKVLKVIKKNRIYKGLKVKTPNDTRYIKITDMYNLINIKRGLSIIVR
ncbi:MAG: hypothetical protein CSA86_04640 [Arcobacter sp.]|nr:MAG: hypothetical protein CSA86_04640 [Arcobacter sp.]